MIAHNELTSFFDIVSASDFQLKNCVAYMINCCHEYKFPLKTSARVKDLLDSEDIANGPEKDSGLANCSNYSGFLLEYNSTHRMI